jgi:vacuolar protein sorting-associated protein 13A/C
MAPQKTVQEVARYVKENNIPEKEFSKLNETMKIGARLQRLEIFLCKTYDLGKKDDFK